MTKILLVEDDKSLREIYSVRLQAEGYTVLSSGDGEEALATVIGEKPDLIVSDVMMPKISGFEMLDLLKSNAATRDIPVIMLTALSSDQQRNRGGRLGAEKYLVKSQVGIEDIIRAVHDVLKDNEADAPDVTTETIESIEKAPAPAPVASINDSEPIIGNPSITGSNFKSTSPAAPANASPINSQAATNPASLVPSSKATLPDTPINVPTNSTTSEKPIDTNSSSNSDNAAPANSTKAVNATNVDDLESAASALAQMGKDIEVANKAEDAKPQSTAQTISSHSNNLASSSSSSTSDSSIKATINSSSPIVNPPQPPAAPKPSVASTFMASSPLTTSSANSSASSSASSYGNTLSPAATPTTNSTTTQPASQSTSQAASSYSGTNANHTTVQPVPVPAPGYRMPTNNYSNSNRSSNYSTGGGRSFVGNLPASSANQTNNEYGTVQSSSPVGQLSRSSSSGHSNGGGYVAPLHNYQQAEQLRRQQTAMALQALQSQPTNNSYRPIDVFDPVSGGGVYRPQSNVNQSQGYGYNSNSYQQYQQYPNNSQVYNNNHGYQYNAFPNQNNQSNQMNGQMNGQRYNNNYNYNYSYQQMPQQNRIPQPQQQAGYQQQMQYNQAYYQQPIAYQNYTDAAPKAAAPMMQSTSANVPNLSAPSNNSYRQPTMSNNSYNNAGNASNVSQVQNQTAALNRTSSQSSGPRSMPTNAVSQSRSSAPAPALSQTTVPSTPPSIPSPSPKAEAPSPARTPEPSSPAGGVPKRKDGRDPRIDIDELLASAEAMEEENDPMFPAG